MALSTSQTRVKQELDRWMEKLEKESIRGLQAKSYKCAARCCENPTSSREEVQQCLNKCFVPIQQIQEYQGKELQAFQDRLHRCAQQCEDDIRDSVGPNTTQAEFTKYQAQLESCVDRCCLSHLELVPKMFERMKTVMSQVQEPSVT